jgi:hypothetical protein
MGTRRFFVHLVASFAKMARAVGNSKHYETSGHFSGLWLRAAGRCAKLSIGKLG